MNLHEQDDESWVERVRGSKPPRDAEEALLLPALRAAIYADAQQRAAAQTAAGLQRLFARLEAQGLIEPEADETQRWIEVVQGRRAAADEIEAVLAPALRQAIEADAAVRGEAALLARLERAGLLAPINSAAAVDSAQPLGGSVTTIAPEARALPQATALDEALAPVPTSEPAQPSVPMHTPVPLPTSVPMQNPVSPHTPVQKQTSGAMRTPLPPQTPAPLPTTAATPASQRVAEPLRRRRAANWPWFAGAAAVVIAVLTVALYLRPQPVVYPPGSEILRGVQDVALLPAADPAARAAQVQRELRALGFSVQVREDGAVRIVEVSVPERGLAAYQVWLQRSVSPSQRVTVAGNYRVVVQPENAP